MELGENLCIPNGAPKCELCPLATLCVAHKENLTDTLPKKSPQRPKKEQERTVFLIDFEGRFAIRKRPPQGLLADLWEFPSTEGRLDAEHALEAVRTLGFTPLEAQFCGNSDHIFTHVTWHMTGFYVPCKSTSATEDFLLLTPEEIREHYAIPKAFGFFEAKMQNFGVQ